ncbi:hypothetical protein B0H16DRAFT_1615148 [Mycena metata]|uniref:F-box domain-containing protein n=1 Tax=Mycena metata TaxID=1033252 RepID=A0AAD7H9R4_9AGAR|nr:hypothetical protein B0H16DRAFT_1615148 [Mycena metata]
MRIVQRKGAPRRAMPLLSASFIDVPPELCALIARFASRCSVARLCCLSSRFNFIFSPLLYYNLVEPPLTPAQSSRLFETLSKRQTNSQPALLVRHLGLTRIPPTASRSSPRASTNAITSMFRLLCDNASPPASGLRRLHWSVGTGVDELGLILGGYGAFPHLKELRVMCGSYTTNFNFMKIAGLEVLGVQLNVDLATQQHPGLADSICRLLGQALQSLPATSPSLCALHIKLVIPFSDVYSQL